MADMMSFCSYMLSALATFLNTPPIFYLFGLVLFTFVIKDMVMLIRRRLY